MILYYCKKCNKPVEKKFGAGIFCSRSCANSRTFSEETNKKRSISNTIANIKRWDRIGRKPRFFCKICNKQIGKTKNGMCRDCLKSSGLLKEILSRNGKATQAKLLAEGRHKGWISRNISSFPETFWSKVLDNNGITYEREFVVIWGNPQKGERYFLDFLLKRGDKLIDLEIDGGQHKLAENKEHDKARDAKLVNLGYIVYRIDWNEVKTEEGKLRMKEKIESFLSWIQLFTY